MSETYPDVPGHNGTDTSIAAAESIKPIRAVEQRRVLRMFELYRDGLTCDRIESMTGMSHQSCSARIRDLVIAGAIRDTGRTQPTRSGRAARVYELVANA